ncbi:MAG: hypothetical protein AAFX39_01530 [Pseudomonadota bacterium]
MSQYEADDQHVSKGRHSADLETRYKTVGVRAVTAAAPFCKGDRRKDERPEEMQRRDEHDFGTPCTD